MHMFEIIDTRNPPMPSAFAKTFAIAEESIRITFSRVSDVKFETTTSGIVVKTPEKDIEFLFVPREVMESLTICNS